MLLQMSLLRRVLCLNSSNKESVNNSAFDSIVTSGTNGHEHFLVIVLLRKVDC